MSAATITFTHSDGSVLKVKQRFWYQALACAKGAGWLPENAEGFAEDPILGPYGLPLGQTFGHTDATSFAERLQAFQRACGGLMNADAKERLGQLARFAAQGEFQLLGPNERQAA
jgi:hypothetical protein